MSPINLAKPPIIIASEALINILAGTCIGRKILTKKIQKLNTEGKLSISTIEGKKEDDPKTIVLHLKSEDSTKPN